MCHCHQPCLRSYHFRFDSFVCHQPIKTSPSVGTFQSSRSVALAKRIAALGTRMNRGLKIGAGQRKARGLDPWRWPNGSQPLGTRMYPNGNTLSLTSLDACAVEPGQRFVTERGRKKKESRNLNPGLSAWVKSAFPQFQTSSLLFCLVRFIKCS